MPIRRKAVFFSGSTVGNLPPPQALEFLQLARRSVGAGGQTWIDAANLFSVHAMAAV